MSIKKPLHILHIEDNPNDAELIGRMLADAGIATDVVRVETKADFLVAIGHNGFDLIISDYTLPSFDGLSALRIAHEKCPDVPFIFVSGTIGEASAIESLVNGAVDYVLKNNLSRLVPAVRRVLRDAENSRKRKQAEEALQNAEERYRALFEQSPNGVLLVDIETGKTIEANEAAYKQLGYSRDEFVALRISDYEALEEPEETAKHMQKIIRVGNDDFETLHRTKNGEIRNVHVWAKTIQLGERLLFLGVFQDITVRKQAEKELRRLRKAVESSGEAMFLTDRDGIITYVNPEFTRFYGFTSEEVVGKVTPRILKSGKQKPEEYEFLWKTILGKQVVKVEIINKTKDGRIVTAEGSVNPILDERNDIVGFLAVQSDITDRKRAEEERKNLEAQLIQAQKMESIGTLAGGIAHDFNNILGIILGYIGVLQIKERSAGQISEVAKQITRAVERGAALVKQLLTFARQTEAKIEPVDVNALVKELVKMLGATFPKTVELLMHVEESIPLVKADSGQLHQALLNLCVNARDAMPSKGTLSISTKQMTGRDMKEKFPDANAQSYVCIHVADTGTGMDDETRGRIFEPFFTTKGIGKGTGLGLAVVHGVVSGLHGFIDVQSRVGSGTTFSLHIPVPAQEVQAAATEVNLIGEIPGGEETILLMEDEEALSFLLKTLLETKGYTVLVARDGLEGVGSFMRRPHDIDLVLSDMGLPKMSGWDAATKMREIRPDLKVVLASGFIDPNQRSEILKSGARDILQKPYVPNDVLRRIREILDSK